MLYVRFVIATLALALTMPIPRNTRPPIERSINPNTCSTRQRIFDFERLCILKQTTTRLIATISDLFLHSYIICTNIQNNTLINNGLIYRTCLKNLQIKPTVKILSVKANLTLVSMMLQQRKQMFSLIGGLFSTVADKYIVRLHV